MIRAEVGEQIAELVADDPGIGSVVVAAFYKGDKWASAEAVFCGPTTNGDAMYPYSMDGQAISRDNFTQTWIVRVAGISDVLAARKRCQDLAGLFVSIAGRDRTLGGFVANGEAVCEVGPFAVSFRDGEARDDRGNQGVVAIAEVAIQIETQTTNED
jgi:hypothetical protein